MPEKKVDYTVVILQSKLTKQRGEDKKVNAKSFYFTSLARKSHHLAPVVQTLDSVIHRINHYSANATHQPTALILAPKGTVIQRMQQILR